jgi:GNAT superfamily N-acetyltransferase
VNESTIVIRKLAPALLADFLAYFDHDAFADNAKWASCYCQCFYVDHTKVKWTDRTGTQNREQACAKTLDGTMQGYLAYVEGKPVGWCNAAPWRLMTALHDEPDPLADQLGEITCFVVAEPYRRRGVARHRLNAACEGLRAQGLSIAEAYAKPEAQGAAANHHGPLGMYLGAGFQVHRKDDDGGVFVRKSLL